MLRQFRKVYWKLLSSCVIGNLGSAAFGVWLTLGNKKQDILVKDLQLYWNANSLWIPHLTVDFSTNTQVFLLLLLQKVLFLLKTCLYVSACCWRSVKFVVSPQLWRLWGIFCLFSPSDCGSSCYTKYKRAEPWLTRSFSDFRVVKTKMFWQVSWSELKRRKTNIPVLSSLVPPRVLRLQGHLQPRVLAAQTCQDIQAGEVQYLHDPHDSLSSGRRGGDKSHMILQWR